jgi:hypothetical protein
VDRQQVRRVRGLEGREHGNSLAPQCFELRLDRVEVGRGRLIDVEQPPVA